MIRSVSISLVLLIIVSVVGISVNTHYCHGVARYSSIATNVDPESCCGDEMDRCSSCEDHLSSNVMDEQSVMIAAPSPEPLAAVQASIPTDELMDRHPTAITVIQQHSHGPPGRSAGSAIPVLYQTFLI